MPWGEWAGKRLASLSTKDVTRQESKVGSGMGKTIANWHGRKMAYPSNVLHLATECNNKGHSAAFPDGLPRWFIELLTDPGDVVLDPFAGSGTTLKIAQSLARQAIGIDLFEENVALCEAGLQQQAFFA